jgi:ParB family chromosome partitioning protein
MAQKQVLGKGLASLFPSVGSTSAASAFAYSPMPSAIPVAPQPVANEAAPASIMSGAVAAGPALPAELNKDRIPGLAMANVDDIQVNQYQPRRDFDDQALEELAQSIRSNGIIQPLVVRKSSTGSYELIAGERRLRASKIVGLKQVPIVIRRSTDREALELALIENIQRQNLNCVDEALAYFQLIEDFALTQEEVAVRVGKERATVANFLRLLRLPQEILGDLKAGQLSLGHGKALLSLEDPALRLRARSQIIEKHLSVRDAEALVEQMKQAAAQGNAMPEANKPSALSPVKSRLMNIGQELCRRWSTKVEVKGSERRGKIVIHYASRQELERLIENMHNHQ